MNTGSCHCKSVTFEINESSLSVRYCYCETCRKLSGAAFSVVAKISTDNFKITKALDSLLRYESKPGKFRYYCSSCFSPIYVAVDSEPAFVRVRLGLLNGRPQVKVTGHMWVSEKPDWYQINDDLPKYQNEYNEMQ